VAVFAVAGGVWLAAKGIQVGALVAVRSAELLGAGLERVGEQAVRERTRWEAEHAVLVRWEAAARRVVDVNARIQVVTRDAGTDLARQLPVPLSLCAQSPEELLAWCDMASKTIDAVAERVVARTSAAVLSVLRTCQDTERPMSADDALRRYESALAARRAGATQVPPAALAAVTRIVGRLSPNAADADRAAVLAAASQVAARVTATDHNTRLDQLRLLVQRAETNARRRRADALFAATMLQAIPEGVPGGADDPELPGMRAELTDVVAARRELDQSLRERVESVRQRVRARMEHEYVRASVADTLTDLGYEVEENPAAADRLRLTRPDWSGHAVQVVVAGDEVRAAVVRLADRTGTDARREDVEREEQWCADLARLRTALDGAGMTVVQRHIVPPGERIPPLVKRHDTVAARQLKARELPR